MPHGGRTRPGRAPGTLLAFALCCALLAAACTHRPARPGQPGSASTPPRVGGTLQIALLTPGPLDPAQATTPERRLLVGNLFDSLTTLDAAGAVRPAAATSWSSDPGQRHWRFQLRPNARYAGGQPVQARDFKAAWERLASPTTRPRPPAPAALLGLVDGYAAFAAGHARGIIGIAAPDPSTLQVNLTQPDADLPALLADPRLSPVPPSALGRGAAAFAARPLGNGPFMLARPIHANTLELVRNPRYAGRAAYLDRVRVQVVPDPQTAWLAFQHGQVSFGPVPPDQVAAARAIAGTSADGRTGAGVLLGAELGGWTIGFDLDGGLGGDARWRRAVSLALDRAGIAAAVRRAGLGEVAPAAGVVPDGVPGARQDPCSSCQHDPEQSRALLDLIGPAGRKPVVMAVQATPFDRQLAGLVTVQLARAGLRVKVEQVAAGSVLDAEHRPGAQLFGFGWAADSPRMEAFLAGDPAGADDPQAERLAARARGTADQAARTRLYQQAEQALLEQTVVAPVLDYRHSAVLAPGVEGFDLTPWGAVDLSAVSLANSAK